MSNIWSKTIVYCVCVAIVVIGFLFLFANHGDTLINFIPGEATVYSHFRVGAFSRLPVDQKILLISFLTKKSDILEKNQWEAVFSLIKNKEFSIFILNNKTYLATFLRNEVINSDLSHSSVGRVSFFPKLPLTTKKLVDQDWFQRIYKKIDFADWQAYVQNPALLGIPALANNEFSNPATISGKIDREMIKFSLNNLEGNQSLEKTATAPGFITLPNEKTHFRGDVVNKALYQLHTRDNLSFFILSGLKGVKEYSLSDNNEFAILVDPGQNSLAEAEKAVLNSLAQIFPIKVNKALPDNTIATQLVADPGQWQFVNDDVNSASYRKLVLPESKIDIGIFQNDKMLLISNNLTLGTIFQSFNTDDLLQTNCWPGVRATKAVKLGFGLSSASSLSEYFEGKQDVNGTYYICIH